MATNPMAKSAGGRRGAVGCPDPHDRGSRTPVAQAGASWYADADQVEFCGLVGFAAGAVTAAEGRKPRHPPRSCALFMLNQCGTGLAAGSHSSASVRGGGALFVPRQGSRDVDNR